MFSSRLDWSVRPNPISELLDAKRRAGEPILDLTESNPTRSGIVYPVDEIAAALGDPRVLRYEPQAAGMETAREVVSLYYADRQVTVPADRVLLTASTSEAYAYLFKLLADPGDEILAPRPSYPLFEYLARLENVQVRQYPLFYDHGWHVDIAALESMAGPRTRAIVIVNPNNPTGSYIKQRELAQMVELCARHNLALISDEVFSDYPLCDDPDRIATIAQVQGVRTFVLSGLSKIVGLPQMKLGWIVANDRESLDRLELIADTYLSVGTPVQIALPRLLAARFDIIRQISARTRRNLEWLRARASNDVLQVEGGWCATLRVPRVRSEEEWVMSLLRTSNVLVQPGFFYDFESEAYLVTSLLTPEDRFRAGVEAIVNFEPD